MTNNNNTLKQLKEAFVTGHNGTTLLELMIVILAAPIGVLLYLELSRQSKQQQHDDDTDHWRKHAIIEFFVILFPMLLCQTDLLHPWGESLLILELILAFVIHRSRTTFHHGKQQRQRQQQQRQHSEITPNSSSSSDNNKQQPYQKLPKQQQKTLPFLSSYRSTVMYLTIIAILAVDFQLFPRRFAKTETQGYGLMDLGAGSFVVAAGLISGYARRGRRGSSSSSSSLLGALASVAKRSFPIIVLGTVRLIGTKGLEYQEHVSEYGVHWNFFFTLAFVGIFSVLLRSGIDSLFMERRRRRRYADGIEEMIHLSIPVLLLVGYQLSLTFLGLQDYIERGERRCSSADDDDDAVFFLWGCHFFAANREGVLGCIGYLAMYGMSEEMARFCIWNTTNDNAAMIIKKDDDSRDNDVNSSRASFTSSQTGKALMTCTFLLWLGHFISSWVFNLPTSRRSTNAPFVLWTLATNGTVLLLMYMAHFHAGSGETTTTTTPSPIFAATNRNGLVMFLIANLLTGAVNLGINTLDASRVEAFVILLGYLCCVSGIALILDKGLNATIRL